MSSEQKDGDGVTNQGNRVDAEGQKETEAANDGEPSEQKPKGIIAKLKEYLENGSMLQLFKQLRSCSKTRKVLIVYIFIIGAILSHGVLIYSVIQFLSIRSLKSREYSKLDSVSLIVVPNKDTFSYKSLQQVNILWIVIMMMIPLATVLTTISLITILLTKVLDAKENTGEQGVCVNLTEDTKMFGVAYLCLTLWFMVRTSALQGYLVSNLYRSTKVAKLKIQDFNKYVSSLMLTSIFPGLTKTEESLTLTPDTLFQGLLKKLPDAKNTKPDTLARFIFTTSLYKHYILTYRTAGSTVQSELKATLMAALNTFDPVKQLANNLKSATPCFEYLKKGSLQLRMMSSDATYFTNFVAPAGISQATYVQAVTLLNTWMSNVRRKHTEVLKATVDENIGTPLLNIYFLLINMIPFFYYTLPIMSFVVGLLKKLYTFIMGNGKSEK